MSSKGECCSVWRAHAVFFLENVTYLLDVALRNPLPHTPPIPLCVLFKFKDLVAKASTDM